MARLPGRCAWLLLAAAGCSGNPSGMVTTASSAGRGATSARSSSGSSSGGTRSTSSTASRSGGAVDAGSSSSGSSGSSSSSADDADGGGTDGGAYLTTETLCPSVLVPPTSTTCASGTSFGSQVVDLFACTAIGGASVGAVNAAGVPVSGAAATSASDGTFAICLTSGVPFSVQLQAASYLPTYTAEMVDPEDFELSQIGLFSSAGLQAFEGFIPGGTAPNMAGIILKVTGSGKPCDRLRWGWTFGLTLPDGGAIPDGGFQSLYIATSDLPDPTLTATSTVGLAMLYNIDPALSDFFVVTATNPDAGICTPQNEAAGFTGRVFVSAGAVTYDPLILP